MSYSSQNVELEEMGRLRLTQPCGGGSTSGENTAQPAVPSGCRDPLVCTWSSPGPVNDMVAIDSSANCLCKVGRADLRVGVVNRWRGNHPRQRTKEGFCLWTINFQPLKNGRNSLDERAATSLELRKT
ncbi:hypothetical protein E2C01_047168 [Portunus trituberculatus]|uniref:Uncharacterized protein n=1 Tax=Portunus trituberculatus TaxID=210409 RepID=A0A5B7G6Q6_PORTR|nr:hypothetical protein [Portunus trituberculatus]